MLWTNYGVRTANKIIGKNNAQKVRQMSKVNVAWTTFWGVFPDLFAFTIPFVMLFWNMITGVTSFGSFLSRHGPPRDGFNIAGTLYPYSHSLVIWATVFIIVWIISKRPRFELFGWLLHILIDIPSHALSFYPTPFLFPISNYHFPYGVSWSNMWYMIINYSLLLVVTIYFISKNKKQNAK